jgi:hypothetical protein
MRMLIIILLLGSDSAFAHGGGEEEGSKIGKGITAFDKHDGFKLSAEAKARMKFVFKKSEKPGSISIPKEALVLALSEVHIYTYANDFFKAIDVKIVSKTKDAYVVSSPELKSGQEVVVKGVNYLRVIDMDLNIGEKHEEGNEPEDHKDEHGEHSEKEERHD